MTKKESKGFNFQFKHLVYLFISAMILGTGYRLGDKFISEVSGKVSEFIAKPYVIEKKQKAMQSELILIEKKLNATTARTNALYEGMDNLVTSNDLKVFKTEIIQAVKSEIQNNLTSN